MAVANDHPVAPCIVGDSGKTKAVEIQFYCPHLGLTARKGRYHPTTTFTIYTQKIKANTKYSCQKKVFS